MGMNGALATRSPSGANSAHEKSSLSLIFVLIEVCCNDRPMASATLINRLANSVKVIGSGPLVCLVAVIFTKDFLELCSVVGVGIWPGNATVNVRDNELRAFIQESRVR